MRTAGMRTTAWRRGWWVALGLAGIAVATGCGAEKGVQAEPGVDRRVERFQTQGVPISEPPTSVVKAPATTVPAAAQRPRQTPATTTTTEAPVNGPNGRTLHPTEVAEELPRPWVTTSFQWGPPGQTIEIEGYGLVGDRWASIDESDLWLNSTQPGCDLFARAEHDVVVSADGHLKGSFVVPGTGTCGFAGVMEADTANLDFHIVYQCTECRIGTFTVMPGFPEFVPFGTHCGTTVFSHGDVAQGEVYADGLTCEEAAPVVAEAWQLAPLTGPEEVDIAGFSCERGRQSLSPRKAIYDCSKGSQTVWFLATGRS